MSIGFIGVDILSMPRISMVTVFLRSSNKVTLYKIDSIRLTLPPIVVTSRFTGLPFSPSSLAFLNVIKDNVLPPSQSTVAFIIPLCCPTVSQISCACNIVEL